MTHDEDSFPAPTISMPMAPAADELAAALDGRRIRAELEARLFGDDHEAPSVGRYSIECKLGEGGMGKVYASFDPQRGRRVAIKVVSAALTRGIDRLRREAKAMASLEHPNIVTVYEVGESDDGLYLVMDLIDGQTLRSWAHTDRSWNDAVDLALQVADALAAVHELGVVHRDVKPENILVDAKDQAYLVDFGLAKPLPDSPASELSHFSRMLTRTGDVVGTLGYIAPEQLLGLPVSPACDQFSLCATLFEVLFGVSPFMGKTTDAVAMAIIGGHVSEVSAEVVVPKDVAAVVERGMQTSPKERFASMSALAEALRAAREGPNESGLRAWWTRRRQK